MTVESLSMAVPITRLELRSIEIPRNPIIDALERMSGKAITHEHRHYLAGEPVHCGDILELYQDGQWVRGRYEWTTKLNDAPSFEHANGVVFLSDDMLLRWPR